MEIEKELNLDFINDLYVNKKTFTMLNGIKDVVRDLRYYPSFIKYLDEEMIDYDVMNNKSEYQDASIYQFCDMSLREDLITIQIVNNPRYKDFIFTVCLSDLVDIQDQITLIN